MTMHRQILVITDSLKGSWVDHADTNVARPCHYDLLTLGFNGEAGIFYEEQKYKKLKSFNLINVTNYSESSQEKIRDFIPNFIYEFPRKNIKPRFSILDNFSYKGINFWWFNKMSEKGAWGTPFIKRVYYLDLILKVFNAKPYHEIWFELNDGALLRLLHQCSNLTCSKKNIALKHSHSVRIFLPELLFNVFLPQVYFFNRWLLFKLFRLNPACPNSNETVTKKSLLFFTIYPTYWNLSHNKKTEVFFQSLPQRLGADFNVRYLAWLPKLRLRNLLQNHTTIKHELEKEGIVPLEAHLRLGDFLSLFITSLSYISKVIRYKLTLEPRLNESYEGCDMAPIIKDEFNRYLITPEIMVCLLIMKATNSFLLKNKSCALVYRMEFNPHERALLYGSKRHCLTVGFQHQAIAKNHLQYLFPKEEIELYYFDQEDPNALPLPHKYIVTGESGFEILKNSGFPVKDIVVSGPIRYFKLLNYIKNQKNKFDLRKEYGFDRDQKIFLVANPIFKNEVLSFAISFIRALKECKSRDLFLFKSHPSYNFDKDIIGIINKLYPELHYAFLPNTVELNDYLLLSDALFLSGSTVGIESICLGTMPILLENESTFTLNPLLDIREAYLSARNLSELKEILQSETRFTGSKNELLKNWPAAIRKTFYSISEDPYEKFCAFIKDNMKEL